MQKNWIGRSEGLLVRFALEKYLDSDLYVGHSETPETPVGDE